MRGKQNILETAKKDSAFKALFFIPLFWTLVKIICIIYAQIAGVV